MRPANCAFEEVAWRFRYRCRGHRSRGGAARNSRRGGNCRTSSHREVRFLSYGIAVQTLRRAVGSILRTLAAADSMVTRLSESHLRRLPGMSPRKIVIWRTPSLNVARWATAAPSFRGLRVRSSGSIRGNHRRYGSNIASLFLTDETTRPPKSRGTRE